MTDDVKALIAEARLWNVRVVRNHVSSGFLDTINRLADALEAATVAPAVDREALVWQMYDLLGGDTALGSPFMPDEGIAHNARSVADALLASGLLRDVRDVQAEARRDLVAVAWLLAGPDGARVSRTELHGMPTDVSVEWFDDFATGDRVVRRAQAIREAQITPPKPANQRPLNEYVAGPLGQAIREARNER